MITLYHDGAEIFGKHGVPPAKPCFKPALQVTEWTEEMKRGLIPAAVVRTLDGSIPKRGDIPVCGSCGESIIIWHLSDRSKVFA